MAKDKYDEWRAKLKISKEFQKKKADLEAWKRYTRYYKGEFFLQKTDEDRVSVNMVHPTVKVLQAALASRDPEAVVKARKPEFESREDLFEAAINYDMQRIGYKHTLKRIIRDTHIFGMGISKVGYNFSTEKKEEVKDTVETPFKNEYLKDDSVYFTRVSPYNFFVDTDATELLVNAKYCIERLVKPRKYVEKKYKVDLSGSKYVPDLLMDIIDFLGIGDKRYVDKIEIYEIWDLENMQRMVLTEEVDKFLYEGDWEEGLDGFPYDILAFSETPDEFYPVPDIKLYEAQQREKNYIRSLMANHVKRFNRRYQVQAGTMTLEEIKKFEQNVDGSVVQYKQGNGIAPIADAPMPTDWSQYEARIDDDQKGIMGTNELLTGGSSNVRKTATEAAVTDAYMRLRIGDRQAIVEDFVQKSITKMAQLMQENYDRKRYVKVLGEDGKFIQTPWSKEDIEGQYDFEVKVGSTAPTDDLLRSRQVMEAFKMLAGNPYVDQKELTELYVDVVLEKYNTTKLLIPTADEISKDPYKQEIARRRLEELMQKAKGAEQKGGQMGSPSTLSPEETGAPVAGQYPTTAGAKRESEIIQAGQGPGGIPPTRLGR